MSPLQNSARNECVPMRIHTTNQIIWLNRSFESQIIQTDNPYFCVVWKFKCPVRRDGACRRMTWLNDRVHSHRGWFRSNLCTTQWFHNVSFMYNRCSSGIYLMHDKCSSGICLMYEPLRTYIGCGESVPGIPSACATRNFTYLVRAPYNAATLCNIKVGSVTT